ncbi:uncharacterized protein LOC121394195 [Xenopus laevis]|uniref:Uncharacterized protein LOC121394194 n=1 Tax=Xenopus laevis TaxID=8355 RepID=A0A8J1KST9_XENLA|nr:uncharacterized protein LOC121394194 [Xenopus laevis]XP_041420376.1 uncharacterized protein LOC121394195 [Xenopus laevis]
MNPSQTESGASTFAYSEKEIQEILEGIEASLTISEHKPENRDLARELYSFQKNEVTINLHISTLAQYVKARFIPRGLRVNLQPNLCADDSVLTKRWEEICNKCSLDLMVLTIERLQEKVKSVRLKVADLKEKVTAKEGTEVTKNILAEHADLLLRHREKLVERKQRKFERDAKDFRENRVYTWREERRRQRFYQDGEEPVSQTDLPAPYPDRVQPVYRYGARNTNRRRGREYTTYQPRYTRERSSDSSRSSTSTPSTSSTSNPCGNYSVPFLGGTHEQQQRRNPREPIQREQYPSRKRR